MARILVVEDDEAVQRGLLSLLRTKGYEPILAENGHEALIKAEAAAPDLVLLDVMIPGLDGFEVLKELRSRGDLTPVVMLTARGSEVERVLGFQLGVDDYVVKPFSILELLGRIEAVLRRSQPVAPAVPASLALGAVEVDFERLEVRREGARQDVPLKAIAILRVLAAAGGQIVSRDRLQDEVWGRDQALNPRTIDNLVVKLRQAIESPDGPRRIQAVPGEGYRLVVGD